MKSDYSAMRKKILQISDEKTIATFIKQLRKQATIDILDELTDGQYSKNSLLAMVKDWNLFIEFCTQKHVSSLPASVTAVRLFIEHEAARRKFATIRRYNVTIGLIHRILSLKDPTANPQVIHTMNFFKVEKKNDTKDTVPFEKQHLEKLSAKLMDSTHPIERRNLAVYYIMFECALKRSELKSLTVNDIISDNGNKQLAVYVGAQRYDLSEQAQRSLRQWLSLLPSIENNLPLFSAIDRHGNINSVPLDDSSIYRIQRYASDLLGLKVGFSGQSSRVGKVKDLAKQGMTLRDIQHYGRWLSPAMPNQYLGNIGKAELEKMVFKRFKPLG